MKTIRKLIAYNIGPLGWILMSIFFLIYTLTDENYVVHASIKENKKALDTIASFQNIKILGPGEIIIEQPSIKVRLLAPHDLLIADPLYCIIIIIVCIILLFTFWNFSFKNPFLKQTFHGIRLITWAMGIFMTLNHFRYFWFITEVQKLTHGLYEYKTFIFQRPEFWLFMILYRLVYVFKKGYNLQREQELTV
jgi:hypothetical protein